jgi:plastocyanin
MSRHRTGTRGRIGALVAIAAVAAVAVPAAASGGARTASSHTVTLHEFRFHPASLTIHRGDKVKWVWRDETEHNVTFPHRFHSRTQVQGSYTVQFSHSGTFKYECTIHGSEGMRGKIVVH